MLHKLKRKANGFLDSEEYRSMPKPEKIILKKISINNCKEFFTFCWKIKDKPRDLIKKFVHNNKDLLDKITVEQFKEIFIV